MRKRKGVGRGLEPFEVAVIKNMRQRKMKRDFIMSLILRPGRVLSPAAVDEVTKGKIGPEIDPATDAETDLFIQRRLTASPPINKGDLGGPTSQTVVADVLRAATASRDMFAAFENRSIEFKSVLPTTTDHRGAIAKSMAAFANAGGGYIVFGVGDDCQILGIPDAAAFQKVCDRISDIVTLCFSPTIMWEKNAISFAQKTLGVIYVYQASIKPVISMHESAGISKSLVYYRYEGKSQRIEPGDLLHMLHERDRAVAAAAAAPPIDFRPEPTSMAAE